MAAPSVIYDLHEKIRERRPPSPNAVGGANLVGRHYVLRGRPVTVLTGWGPGATVRNVCIRYDDTGDVTVRPFRGLRLPTPRSSA